MGSVLHTVGLALVLLLELVGVFFVAAVLLELVYAGKARERRRPR